MSPAQVKHEVLFLFTNRLLLQQALHSSSTFSRCRPQAHPLLSLHWICIFLCQVFNVSQKLYHSPGRDVWSIKRLKRHHFLKTPTHAGFFSPPWETCEQLRRSSFASHRMNFSGHPSKIIKEVFLFFVIEMLRLSDRWEKDKRAAWEPNRKTFWPFGPSSRSVSEKHF